MGDATRPPAASDSRHDDEENRDDHLLRVVSPLMPILREALQKANPARWGAGERSTPATESRATSPELSLDPSSPSLRRVMIVSCSASPEDSAYSAIRAEARAQANARRQATTTRLQQDFKAGGFEQRLAHLKEANDALQRGKAGPRATASALPS